MKEHEIRQILSAHRLAPSKQLGQNFLVQPAIAQRIVATAGVGAADSVVELGVGLGSLTRPLAAQAGRVVGLELDAGIVEYHRQSGELPANVTLIHQDLLKADYRAMAAELGGRLKLLANLPYSVTNPLLFRLLDFREDLDWVVLMIQKEVAQRLLAPPGGKEYGILSVLLATCAKVEKLFEVGPGNFYPKPKVDSVVIRLRFTARPGEADFPDHRLDAAAFARLRRVVGAAFGQRRKTLLNSLSAGLPELSRQEVAAALAAADLDPGRRAESLTCADYLRLSAALP